MPVSRMPVRVLLLAAVALAGLMAGPGLGATWYLSPTGSDSTGEGSLTNPWYELEVAVNRPQVQSGDEIVLLDGLYDYGADKQSIGRSFDPNNPLIIRAANPLGAIIQGAGDPPGGNSDTEGIGIHGASGIVLDGLEIRHSGDNVLHIGVAASYITVRNCEVHDAGTGGDAIKVNGSHHIVIENCTVYDPGRRRGSQSWTWQENIDFCSSSDCVVRNCLLFHTARGGDTMLYAKYDSFRIVFEGNVLMDQYAGAFFPPVTLGGTLHSEPAQLIDDGAVGDDGPPPDPDPSDYGAWEIVFRNNLVIRATRGGLGIFSARDAWVVNNVFYDCAGGGIWVLSENNANRTSRDCHVHNNVFFDPDGDMEGVYRRGLTASGLPMIVYNFAASNNLFYNAGATVPATGFLDPGAEAGAVFADPRFVSPGAGGADLFQIAHNYWLLPGSPAIDAGAEMSAAPYPQVLLDFDGIGRPVGGAFDIGMFEFTILGDIDHDGMVTVFDVISLVNTFGLSAGDPGFDARADFDSNGVVDVFDAITIVNNFGATP